MDDEAKLLIVMWIKNCIVLICFTILAVVFKEWWIVLISLLFWTFYDSDNGGKE